MAAENGHTETVVVLLEKGADVTSVNKVSISDQIHFCRSIANFPYLFYISVFAQDGSSALELAAQQGFLEIVELLLKVMTDVKLSADLDLLIECLRAGEKVFTSFL